ncbi:Gfo/Idh/MocA family oxidoreductase [Streptosporangium sp. NPDC006013]|uniref:Gfo/Idh/MocA family oxidoreductase n=1 Tax=Streptosporangium sp. NPDC006013 TaxID=3155596 RepID=UPI0033B7A144
MPLLARYATPAPHLGGWAVIFRDHFVENTLAFLLAVQQAGVPPEWIYALAKGDRTYNRDRVHATLLAQGCRSGLLDNTAINAPNSHADDLAQAFADVDAFIDAAHAVSRKVLVIDDGGLLAHGYGRADSPHRVDAALELTVSGLKRITAAGPLGIPVLNLARSALKTNLGYPEIADSCLRRLRALLPAIKVIGRTVLVLGYGTLGSRLAAALRAQGCQVHIVDPDPLALIAAAEAGHPTYRTAVDALHAVRPFLLIGTTGEDALTAEAVGALPDGVVLAPYATKDFAVLATDPALAESATEIPGIGRRYRLRGGAQATVLGDGRSLNLFEADAIPNQGYDAYRAGTLLAAKALCARVGTIPAGVHTDLVDDIITSSGLYDAYYDTYLTIGAPAQLAPIGSEPLAGMTACVIGYGAAGRLHAQFLTDAGAQLMILDPKHQDLPKGCRTFCHGVDELPRPVAADVDLWSVCCPTADHLPVLRSILTHDPGARVLLEKPACQGHEIDALIRLLDEHPTARVMVIDQYRHARALGVVADLIKAYEPGASLRHIGITFTKDRSADIADGRFVDRSYGVLGYEWLHMLAVLRRLLPADDLAAYLATDPRQATLRAIYDPRLFVSTLTEHTTLRVGDALVPVELHSSITGSAVVLGRTPDGVTGGWRRGVRLADDRHRYLTVHVGRIRISVHLDPVTTADGWQLDRNHHRVVAERDDEVLHDQVIEDSPLRTAIREAADALTSLRPLPPLDLGPLRRITALAEHLRVWWPKHSLKP